MDSYEMLSVFYPGWSLQDIKALSSRERYMWLEKGMNRPKAVR